MKTLLAVIVIAFVYETSLAQGTSYFPVLVENDPPANTEVKDEESMKMGDLKGPKAKNYPKYRYDASEVVVEEVQPNEERLVGPAAKNYKPWEDSNSEQHVVITVKEKKNLKGPRAKNQKPWDN